MRSGRADSIPSKALSIFKSDRNTPAWLQSLGSTLSETVDELDKVKESPKDTSLNSSRLHVGHSSTLNTLNTPLRGFRNQDNQQDEKKIRILVSKEFSFANFVSKTIMTIGGIALALFLIMEIKGFSKGGTQKAKRD